MRQFTQHHREMELSQNGFFAKDETMIAEHVGLSPREAFRKVMEQLIACWELMDIKPTVSRIRQKMFLYYDVHDLREIVDDLGNLTFTLRVTRLLPSMPYGSTVKIRGWNADLEIRNTGGRMFLVDPTSFDSLVDVEDESALNGVFERLRPQDC